MQEHSDNIEHNVQPVKAAARGTESGLFKPVDNADNVSFVYDLMIRFRTVWLSHPRRRTITWINSGLQ
jgi:hypothetical protein